MQNIKIAPTFFIIKNVVKIKNVKKRKKRDINKKRKKRFLHLWYYRQYFIRWWKTSRARICILKRPRLFKLFAQSIVMITPYVLWLTVFKQCVTVLYQSSPWLPRFNKLLVLSWQISYIDPSPRQTNKKCSVNKLNYVNLQLHGVDQFTGRATTTPEVLYVSERMLKKMKLTEETTVLLNMMAWWSN